MARKELVICDGFTDSQSNIIITLSSGGVSSIIQEY